MLSTILERHTSILKPRIENNSSLLSGKLEKASAKKRAVTLPKRKGNVKAVADFVRRRRAELDLTYEQVAERSGEFTTATAQNIETARHKSLKAETMAGLARALEVTMDQLWALYSGKPLGEAEHLVQVRHSVPLRVKQALEMDAARCRRTPEAQLLAILEAIYFNRMAELPDLEAARSLPPSEIETQRLLPPGQPDKLPTPKRPHKRNTKRGG